MSFTQEFNLLLKARYPIIYVTTIEEDRLEYTIRNCIKKNGNRGIYIWDFVEGYINNPNNNGLAKRNPLQALEFIEKIQPETPAIFLLKDFNRFLNDVSVSRKLKNLIRILKTQPKTLIIVATEVNIPNEFIDTITILEFQLPQLNEIKQELDRLVNSLNQKIENNVFESLINSCQGLSLERIRRVLSKIIALHKTLDERAIDLILKEKRQIIYQTQVLEFCLSDNTIADIGGLTNLKNWLTQRAKSFSNRAKNYGLPAPRGLLLIGIQGTGKSLTAKAIANDWQLPLLKLDFGRLFGGIVGESEMKIRQMIQIAETLAPCILWIDEIDKTFGQINSKGDSGTTSRVLGTFITWLSEKTAPVFVVSTANNFDVLPVELIRKGRFDEMFFLNLPTEEEREAIFSVHLERFRPASLEKFQLPILSKLSKDFSGAEIEQVVIEAMRLGFNEGREFTNEDILVSIQNLVPLARTKSKELDQLKEWSESGNVTSASKY